MVVRLLSSLDRSTRPNRLQLKLVRQGEFLSTVLEKFKLLIMLKYRG